MSKSTRRNCVVCGETAHGPKQNGRRNFGGTAMRGKQIMVGGKPVNAGVSLPVCDVHNRMVVAVRATARHEGHGARQAAEAAILECSEEVQEIMADRGVRLEALTLAALQTITREEYDLFVKHAHTITWKAARGTLAFDTAMDDLMNAFCDRVAQKTLREIGDDVPALEAVLMVDRASVQRGMSMLNLTRTGQLARVGSLDADCTDTDGQSIAGAATVDTLTDDYSAFASRGEAYRLESGRTILQPELFELIMANLWNEDPSIRVEARACALAYGLIDA